MEEGVCSFFIKIPAPGNYEKENRAVDEYIVSFGYQFANLCSIKFVYFYPTPDLTWHAEYQVPGLRSDTPHSSGVSNDTLGILLCICERW